MTLAELEESRPATDDGNHFIWLLRNGTLREAEEELFRLISRKQVNNRYGNPKNHEWDAWGVEAMLFIRNRAAREAKETAARGE